MHLQQAKGEEIEMRKGERRIGVIGGGKEKEFRRGGSTTPVFKPGKTQLINRFRILKLESVVSKIN